MKLPFAEQSFIHYLFSLLPAMTAFAEQPFMCPVPLHHKHMGHKCVSYVFATLSKEIFRKWSGFKNSTDYSYSFRVLKLKPMAIQSKCQWRVDLLLAKCIPPLKNSRRTKNINVSLPSHFSIPGLPVLTVSEHTGVSSTSVNCHLSLFLLPNTGKGYVQK